MPAFQGMMASGRNGTTEITRPMIDSSLANGRIPTQALIAAVEADRNAATEGA